MPQQGSKSSKAEAPEVVPIADEGESEETPNEPRGYRTLLVSEIFGPTLQGEGPNIGRPTLFLRLGGCNLTCQWCDTPYTWRWSRRLPHRAPMVYNPDTELQKSNTVAVLHDLKYLSQTYQRKSTALPQVKSLVITGGEPLLQSDRLVPLLRHLKDDDWHTEIETNGTIRPSFSSELISQYNVSPKLASAGVQPKSVERINWEALEWFSSTWRAYLKFVVSSARDLDEVDNIVTRIAWPHDRVYIMCEGSEPDVLLHNQRVLVPHILERGYLMTTRLHTLIWGSKRGV